LSGFDPIKHNPFKYPNGGFKNTLFKGLKPDDKNAVLPFIDRSELTLSCGLTLKHKVFESFEQYKDEARSDIAFVSGADTSTGYHSKAKVKVDGGKELPISVENELEINFGINSGRGRGESTYEDTIKDFFRETQGEIVQMTAECITHTVAISSFAKPEFTEAFTEAIRSLHTAAKDPDSSRSNDTFRKFINDYGTHYMQHVELGSKLVFQKLFSESSRSVDEGYNRKECIKETLSSTDEFKFLFFGHKDQSGTKSAECNSTDRKIFKTKKNAIDSFHIVAVGAPPTRDVEKWADHVLNSPIPINYKLQKISTMLGTEGFVDGMKVDDEDVNGTAILNFIETKSVSYGYLILGKDIPTPELGCGLTSNCTAADVCENDETLGFRCVADSCKKLKLDGHEAFTTDSRGYTQLMKAATENNVDRVKTLISCYKKEDKLEEWVQKACGRSGKTALHLAVGADVASLLVGAGARVGATDAHNRTALHDVARAGHTPALRALLAAQAPVDARDSQGATPLMEAAAGGGLEDAQLLVQYGAEVRAEKTVPDYDPIAVAMQAAALKKPKCRYYVSHTVTAEYLAFDNENTQVAQYLRSLEPPK